MIHKTFYSVLFSTILMTLSAASVSASGEVVCQPTYGGVYGGPCVPSVDLTIDKKVQNPSTGVFVDNLSVNDPKFAPEQVITFKIVVTNTGSKNLDTVTVKDIFPSFVTFSGGAGFYDASKNTLTLTLDSLKSGESRTFTIGGRVASLKDLPSDKMISCVINQAQATSENQTVSDNAQLCIEKVQPSVTKGGLPIMPSVPVKQTPSTGPEMALLFGLIPMGSLGYFLRKKSQLNA